MPEVAAYPNPSALHRPGVRKGCTG